MNEHEITIHPASPSSRLAFSQVFNSAVWFIDRHLQQGRGRKTAILTENERVTYGELAERVNRCGNGLLSLGLTPGDRLLLIVEDSPEFFELFWGAIKAGIVPVPLNTLLRASDYRGLFEDSAAAALAYSPRFSGEVEPALASAEDAPRHILKASDVAGLRANFADQSTTLVAHPSAAGDDAFWLYSSGSTGHPKGVVHSHRDLAATCEFYAGAILSITESDVFFSAAKLFFAYGLGNAMTFPLWAGGTSVLMPDRPTPERIFEMIERFSPTLYFGVPTLYAAKLAALETATPDLSSLRLCVSAGEALPADLYRRFREHTGLEILDGIGSTEALHIFLSNRPGQVMPGASGRVVPGYRARIRDHQGNDVAAGSPGQLMIQGPSVMSRYWNRDEKTAAALVDGWLDTGDTYTRDEEGYYFYCGRNDDMLKVGGIWCSPFEIEARLIEHPRVLEAAVVGREDEHGLIKPEAWIVLHDASRASQELEGELLKHCKEGLAPYKYPRWFRWTEELPKTATGKIQRFALRR